MTVFHKTFSQAGGFMALGFAKAYLIERGFSCGHMRDGTPAAIRFGRLKVLPWNNLTDRQKNAMDGIMVGNPRTGPITITIRANASLEAQEAIRK